MRAQWGGSAGIASVVVGRGVEGNAAELGLGGPLGLELPYGALCHPGVDPGLMEWLREMNKMASRNAHSLA